MAGKFVEENFRNKSYLPREVDLGKLFCECFGWSAFQECRSGRSTFSDVISNRLTEGAGAVMTTAFLNVGGQFTFQNILDSYMMEEAVFRNLIPEMQASTLDGEKIPGLTEIGDEAAIRPEADPYALAGFGEDWIFTPPIVDRGMIVPVTWEAVFQDKTGLIAERASQVGKWLGVRREKLAIDAVIDENTTAHRYNWRGSVIATYGDNSGTHTWDNLAASNALVDWTDIDASEQVFNAMVDPFTGEPILWEPRHIVATKGLEQTVRRNLSATEIRVSTPGYATSGNPTQTNAANPYQNKYELVTSRLLASRLATDTDWFLGDVTKLAKCMIAEKLNVIQAPPNNHDEFHRRIVMQHRANERFAYVVVQPRVMVKNTA